ncbi:MAG: FAD-dependent oxidoreductase [Deltaproteobacteria bacterium]|nr:FAD-dependent oxidoreductase [Deltaproteobacteria bacterium]
MRAADGLDLDDNRAAAWAHTARASEPLPPLAGDRLADVVIVGGGFTGVSTAYHLARRYPDRKIALVEARRVGNGASGRNGGMALNWINGVEVKDEVRARRVWAATQRGLDWIDGVVREHDLDVRFRRAGCLEAYTSAARAEAAHRKAEKLASWGIPVRYLDGPALADRIEATGVVGAVEDPTTGQLHGLDLLGGLVPVIRALGVDVYEDSPALHIEDGPTMVVRTPGGTIRAPWLVLATNGYTPSLGYFRTGLFPLHSHVVATEAIGLEAWRKLGWGSTAGFTDDLDRIAYASMTEDGRLLFGGGGNGAYDYYYGNRMVPPAPPTRQWDYVTERLHRYFPAARDVPIAHRWSGTLGITMHRVCSIGITGVHRNILYGVGYSGHGVVLANLAGEVLCDLYSDHHEPWKDLPFYFRRIDGLIPPEPLRWLGYQVFTRLTGRSPRRSEAD